ncbi:hypothetical protein Q428_10745 [Fervidicella metallireducens AeB]|uniref:Uncharacterized protein n=1 Tax=Fervidicella metallireducens AeB TaxID=1403537 RepID=A0A017RTC5_9CLOT|nr:hypothetical protein [Fervidicella metallireducens]EYE87917.1 hypothetical protein Q428_10745 [Fervidicella metallireducens AeB]
MEKYKEQISLNERDMERTERRYFSEKCKGCGYMYRPSASSFKCEQCLYKGNNVKKYT